MDEDEAINYFTGGFKEGYKAGFDAALLVMESRIKTLQSRDSLNKLDGMLDFVIQKEKQTMIDEDTGEELRLSLCTNCWCMTHTKDGKCAKCGEVKDEMHL